jgi:hypothetical protein
MSERWVQLYVSAARPACGGVLHWVRVPLVWHGSRAAPCGTWHWGRAMVTSQPCPARLHGRSRFGRNRQQGKATGLQCALSHTVTHRPQRAPPRLDPHHLALQRCALCCAVLCAALCAVHAAARIATCLPSNRLRVQPRPLSAPPQSPVFRREDRAAGGSSGGPGPCPWAPAGPLPLPEAEGC